MAGRSKKLDATVLSGFCAEVALMLGSGMALYGGIAALHESAPAGPQAEVYARLSENIAKTGSLGEALGADDCWPRYLAHMAAVGERTGRLEEGNVLYDPTVDVNGIAAGAVYTTERFY